MPNYHSLSLLLSITSFFTFFLSQFLIYQNHFACNLFHRNFQYHLHIIMLIISQRIHQLLKKKILILNKHSQQISHERLDYKNEKKKSKKKKREKNSLCSVQIKMSTFYEHATESNGTPPVQRRPINHVSPSFQKARTCVKVNPYY